MTPLPVPAEDWPRFSGLLDACLEHPPAARAVWIDALPAGDAHLREALHAVAVGALPRAGGDWLERPAGSGSHDDDAPASRFAAGQRVGPWRLLRPLGRGGMGEVWLAQRDDGAYVREVALKLPHAFLLAGAQRERFGRERDILAGLSHPRIARLYDAGVATLADGHEQPWLALEHVGGTPITAYCDANALPLRDRIALVRQVADALQAAHARLVVHRDLKPANVLVTDAGEVRLLDFGIAKLLDSADDGATQPGSQPATPGYAAPEQAGGGAITVATDVYALGVMAFELFTGQRPFADASRLGRMLKRRDAPAPLASTRAGGARRKVLAGDLDAILARALEADPAQRYASVEAFSQDLERHLLHRPVAARRIGRVQRALRFARRHRAAVAGAGVVLLVVAVGIAGVLWQAQRARAEARRAEAVKGFLIDVFKASDPRIASDRPRGSITARELVELSAGRIDRQFAHDPGLRIELLRTVAEIWRALDDRTRYAQFQALLLARARAHYGELHEISVDGAVTESQLACAAQEWPRCGNLQAASDALLTRAGMDRSVLRARWWMVEGQRLSAADGTDAARRTAFENAVALFRDHAPRNRNYVTALDMLASDQGLAEGERAIALYRQAIALAQRLPDRNDANLQVTWGNLAVTYVEQGRYPQALEAYRAAVDLARRTTGIDSPRAWVPRSKLAMTQHLMGDRDAALDGFASLLAVLPPPAEREYRATIVRETWGKRLAAEGRAADAIPVLEALEADFRTHAVSGSDLRQLRGVLGDAYDRAGRTADAARMLESAYDETMAQGAADSPQVLAIRERWGRFRLDQGDTGTAQAQFAQVLAQAQGRTLSAVALAHAGMARLALARGDADAALAASTRALALWDRVTGLYDVRTGVRLRRIHADVLAARGDTAAAQRIEDAAARDSARYDAPASPTRSRRDMARLATPTRVQVQATQPAKPPIAR